MLSVTVVTVIVEYAVTVRVVVKGFDSVSMLVVSTGVQVLEVFHEQVEVELVTL